IYLIVDGLPTMGSVMPTRPGVSGRERVAHFERAVRELPINVPVNVILLAMEGDPNAAPAYWLLALNTGGSMLAPAEDWP
ncbi:MAG: VWA domain-containing protein, partial [Gammaproteobacteria bacterium]